MAIKSSTKHNLWSTYWVSIVVIAIKMKICSGIGVFAKNEKKKKMKKTWNIWNKYQSEIWNVCSEGQSKHNKWKTEHFFFYFFFITISQNWESTCSAHISSIHPYYFDVATGFFFLRLMFGFLESVFSSKPKKTNSNESCYCCQ